MDFIKHKAIIFLNQSGIKNKMMTFKRLKKAANKCGFIVHEYSTSKTLLIVFDIVDEAQKAASVSIKDTNGNVLVFINDTLSKDKQLFALAHEIGHIILKHDKKKISSLEQEEAADLFAHYILSNINVHKSLNILIILMLIVVIAVLLMKNSEIRKANSKALTDSSEIYNSSDIISNQAEADNRTYYWTDNGTVFHSHSDCQSIKNSTKVHSGSLTDAKKSKERLCKFCEAKDK